MLQSTTRELWWTARRSLWTPGRKGRPENLPTSLLEGVRGVFIHKPAWRLEFACTLPDNPGHSACRAHQLLLSECTFCADASLREIGLNLAVATMRKGERCHLKVQPEYGYGDRGDRLLFQDLHIVLFKPPYTPAGLDDIMGSCWVLLGNRHCRQAPHMLHISVGLVL